MGKYSEFMAKRVFILGIIGITIYSLSHSIPKYYVKYSLKIKEIELRHKELEHEIEMERLKIEYYKITQNKQ